MSAEVKCVCGHCDTHHPCQHTCGIGPLDCDCGGFRPASEAQPEPAPESVYEKAREALDAGLAMHEIPGFIDRLITAGEAAEKRATELEALLTGVVDRETMDSMTPSQLFRAVENAHAYLAESKKKSPKE